MVTRGPKKTQAPVQKTKYRYLITSFTSLNLTICTGTSLGFTEVRMGVWGEGKGNGGLKTFTEGREG
jgi:hypothetical protein